MKKIAFSKDLLISVDDTDLLKVSKIFLEDIEKNFLSYKDKYLKDEELFAPYKNSENASNYVFEPEKLLKKSPLTIINAPWGSGKTFFVENFIKFFIDKKLVSETFKKIIVIDAWKFSNSQDVFFEFIMELFKKLLESKKIILKLGVEEQFYKKVLHELIPSSISFSLSLNFGIISVGASYQLIRKKCLKKKVNKMYSCIRKNNDPTIIFVDNLERLGKHSWDLLKIILKIQEFSNFLIILPMNLERFENNSDEENNSNEYPIEKYVDFNSFNLKQDYLNFFKKHYEEVISNKLNKIFSVEINSKKLSIREVENLFNLYDLFKFKKVNELPDLLKIIKDKKIWFPEKHFLDSFKDDLKKIFKFEIEKKDLVKDVIKGLESIFDPNYVSITIPNMIPKDDFNIIDDNAFFNFKNYQKKSYIFGKSYFFDLEKLEEKIIKAKKDCQGDILILEKEIQDSNKERNYFHNYESNLKRITINGQKVSLFNKYTNEFLDTVNKTIANISDFENDFEKNEWFEYKPTKVSEILKREIVNFDELFEKVEVSNNEYNELIDRSAKILVDNFFSS